jgi:hypothetical protein
VVEVIVNSEYLYHLKVNYLNIQELWPKSWKCCSLDLKGLLNYKTVLVLLFVVVVNLIVDFLVWRLDFFVHGDLYSYGLIYSLDWANPYWHYTSGLWAFLGGATAFATTAIAPHYLHSRKTSLFSTWTGFFLPLLAIVYEGLGIFYLGQKNYLVWNRLNDYGLLYDIEWAATHSLISLAALALMITAIVALIIPTVRAVAYELKIIRD